MIKELLYAPFQLKWWAAFLFLFPFYTFESGLPQISSYLLIIQFLYLFVYNWNSKLDSFFLQIRGYFGYLVIWVFIINAIANTISVYSDSYEKLDYVLSSLYFVFNFCVFSVPLFLYKQYQKKLIQVTLYAILLSLSAQLILYSLGFGSVFNPRNPRQMFFFNNPNQLGFYGLLVLIVVLSLKDSVTSVKGYYFWYMQIICAYMLFQSSSAAAISSAIVLITIDLIARFKNKIRNIVFFIIVILGFTFLIQRDILFADTWRLISLRFENKQESISSANEKQGTEYEKRNYGRIENHPQHLIWGAGEGAFERFISWDPGNEIHSTFGTLWFCYGTVGLWLFILFLSNVLKHLNVLHQLYTIPLFVYSITHNGLRFSLFWVTIALFVILGYENTKSKYRKKQDDLFNHSEEHSISSK